MLAAIRYSNIPNKIIIIKNIYFILGINSCVICIRKIRKNVKVILIPTIPCEIYGFLLILYLCVRICTIRLLLFAWISFFSFFSVPWDPNIYSWSYLLFSMEYFSYTCILWLQKYKFFDSTSLTLTICI